MKTKGVRKFLRCLKPAGVVDDDDDNWSDFKKCKRKGRSISDGDLGNGNIFVSSFNSSSIGEGRKPKRMHQKLPRFLKKSFRTSKFWKRFGSTKSEEKLSLENTRSMNSHELGNGTPTFQRNSSDSSSSMFTSSSMASSFLASSTCSSSKLICPNDQELAIIEEKSNTDKNNCKKDLMKIAGGCYFGSEYGICFLMLGLLILLIWGKVFAICFTSLCLFFAHPRRLMKVIHHNPNETFDDTMLTVGVPEKQVIIQGFSETPSIKVYK